MERKWQCVSTDELGIFLAAAASSWIKRDKLPLFSDRFNLVLHAALLTADSFARGQRHLCGGKHGHRQSHFLGRTSHLSL